MTIPGSEAGCSGRFELKFVASAVHYHELRAWLRQHAFGFVRSYPSRRINNIYFDRTDFASLVQSKEGDSSRVKVRFRWYGDSDMPTSGQLEVKLRENQLGRKVVYKVPEFCAGAIAWSQIIGGLRANLSAEGRQLLDTYNIPVLLNRYRRDYFLSIDDRLRVTIDRDRVVYDQMSSGTINLRRGLDQRHIMVLEVKGSREDEELISGFVAKLPLRRSRHSKYCAGVEAIGIR